MHMQSEVRNRPSGVNIPTYERFATVALGTTATLLGLRRRSPLGWLLAAGGAALVARGLSGRCAVYRTLSMRDGVEARRSITIQRPRGEIYRLWRRLDNLPKFMEHIRQVTVEDERTSHWLVEEGPLVLEWIAEIIDDVADRRVVWQSVPGSDVENEGMVELRDAPGGRGTEVHVVIRYRPPGGMLVAAPLRALLRRFTSLQLAAELIRLRQLLETGELATGAARPEELAGAEDKAERPAFAGRTELGAASSEREVPAERPVATSSAQVTHPLPDSVSPGPAKGSA